MELFDVVRRAMVCIRLDQSDFIQAKYLLDQGADMNIVKKSDNMTVLHWAAHHGKPQLVQLLWFLVNYKRGLRFKNLHGTAILGGDCVIEFPETEQRSQGHVFWPFRLCAQQC